MLNLKSFEPQLLQTISTHLKHGMVGLIYLDIVNMEQIESKQGRPFGEQMIAAAGSALGELCSVVPDVFEWRTVGDDFFLFVACGESSGPGSGFGSGFGSGSGSGFGSGSEFAPGHVPEQALPAVEAVGEQIRSTVESKLRVRFPSDPAVECSFGCALLAPGERDLETVVYFAMKQSIQDAKDRLTDPDRAALFGQFHAVLRNQGIETHYQPIVSLLDGTVFGYEALTRGPEHSSLRSPVKLFRIAEQTNRLYVLDRLAREKAIAGCGRLARNQRVFLNIPAHIFHDPAFSPGHTLTLLRQHGLNPNNVVFEITERSSIEDFTTVKKVIAHYRSQGYRIAIDDAGAGYSSLQAIAEIQPDYIKIDRSLVHDIHRAKVKEYIMETFITFSRRLNIKLIAEGIEAAEELDRLTQLGIHYGQGYLLGRPAPAMPDIPAAAGECIAAANAKRAADFGVRVIGDIVSPVRTFPATAAVSEVAAYFRNDPEQFGTVVVDGDNRPVGLLMREQLFRKLAVQYGISLYWNKGVSVLADDASLMVEASTPLEIVSQLAMMRESDKLYDMVIVTDRGQLAGVATVRDILEQLTMIRMEHARVANPLTGLPGNIQIQKELQRRLRLAQPFYVVYADLDHFKWFNDRYGFQRGDEVIRFAAETMQQVFFRCGNPGDFIGHIGGDDFIAIASGADPEAVCGELIRTFDRGIAAYAETATAPTPSRIEDRYGNPVEADAVSLSLSLICVERTDRVSADDIARAAALCKKRAKASRGSVVCASSVPGPLIDEIKPEASRSTGS